MIYDIFHLRFSTPLHIGKGGADLDDTDVIYRSDSLKSAIYATGLPIFNDWSDPTGFFGNFLLSSAFPFLGNEYFVPRPIGGMEFDFTDTAVTLRAKTAKKIRYISLQLFTQWMHQPNEKIPAPAAHISPDGLFLFNAPNARNVFIKEVQQRVAKPSDGEDTTPYYLERLYFAKDAGLYFIANFNSDFLKQQVCTTLRILGDNGIGTERSSGNGYFTFIDASDVSTIELPDINNPTYYMPLGLYLPQKTEMQNMNLAESRWDIVRRGGYIAATPYPELMRLRKNNIWFFTEGSVFSTSTKPVGRLVNLKPAVDRTGLHSIWRDGNPIFLPLNL